MLFETPKDCPFCNPKPENVVASHENVYLMKAATPQGEVVPFRYQIVPLRHTTSPEALPDGKTKGFLIKHIPEITEGFDYNLSLNVGHDAGQRVAHVHEWVIIRADKLGIGMSGMITELCDRRNDDDARVLALGGEPPEHEPGEIQY